MESQTKSWIYLLPNGETATDMKQGTERMSKVKGYRISSKTFRHLVKIGVVKRIEKGLLISTANSKDQYDTGETLYPGKKTGEKSKPRQWLNVNNTGSTTRC